MRKGRVFRAGAGVIADEQHPGERFVDARKAGMKAAKRNFAAGVGLVIIKIDAAAVVVPQNHALRAAIEKRARRRIGLPQRFARGKIPVGAAGR